MQQQRSRIALHLALMTGVVALLALCMVYPYLPGSHDRLAMALSTMVQAFGLLGLPLVPAGALWLACARGRPARRFSFAVAALVVASLAAVLVALVALATAGLVLALLTLFFWICAVARIVPALRRLRQEESRRLGPLPLYLIGVPVAVLLAQLALAAPVTAFARRHAIASSEELIHDIEEYRARNGRYPASLAATWKDYSADVIGVERFHYAPASEAYNLFFEQPRFLLDDIGAREFVVYNPLDEHVIISHTAWILLLDPEELEAHQGWFSAHDAGPPHWKSFLFD